MSTPIAETAFFTLINNQISEINAKLDPAFTQLSTSVSQHYNEVELNQQLQTSEDMLVNTLNNPHGPFMPFIISMLKSGTSAESNQDFVNTLVSMIRRPDETRSPLTRMYALFTAILIIRTNGQV